MRQMWGLLSLLLLGTASGGVYVGASHPFREAPPSAPLPSSPLRLHRIPEAELAHTLRAAIDRGTVTGALLWVRAGRKAPYVQALGSDVRGRPIQKNTRYRWRNQIYLDIHQIYLDIHA